MVWFVPWPMVEHRPARGATRYTQTMAGRVAQLALVGLACVLVVGPIALTLADAWTGIPLDAVALSAADLFRLVRSLVYAGLIASLACGVALPMAWWTRRWPGDLGLVLLAPLLIPASLAYSALGLVRDPTTPIGALLARGPATGDNWYPLAADRVLAVVGLGLWAWPIAWIVLSHATRKLDDALLDTLTLDTIRPAQRRWMAARLVAGPIVLAWLLVAVVMLGSAVPLHLAQIDTYATSIWLRLAREPGLGPWLGAWPLVLIAAVASVLIAQSVRPSHDRPAMIAPRPLRWPARIAVLAVLACCTVVPVTLFAGSLHDPAAPARFVRLNADAISQSASVAIVAGFVGVLIGAAVSLAAGAGRRGLGTVAGVMVAGGLIPGVLIGAATAHAWTRWPVTDPIADSLVVVVLGHLARFGMLGVLVGLASARSDPPSLVDQRRLDAATTLRGWLAIDLPRHAPAIVASALAMAALSLHEIEATVMIQPPGTDSLARRLLELLHYLRSDDLAAGMLIVGGASIVLTAAAAGLLIVSSPTASRQP